MWFLPLLRKDWTLCPGSILPNSRRRRFIRSVKWFAWSPAHCNEPTRKLGELCGVSHHTLRAWYRDSTSVRDSFDASGGETMEEKLQRRRREHRELTRANGYGQDCVGFCRSGTRPTYNHMISYIDAYKDQSGIEAICRVLQQVDRGFITSRGYHKSHYTRSQCKNLKQLLCSSRMIQRVHAVNVSVYGIRTLGHAMNREDFHIGRDNTARLMKRAGVSGRRRGRTPVTTISPTVPNHRRGPCAAKRPCTNTRKAVDCRHYLRSRSVKFCLHRFCRGRLQPSDC